MGDLHELIAKLEAATADDQTDVIRECLRWAVGHNLITVAAHRHAYGMCNAGAYLDAALTLVPEGTEWQIHGPKSKPRPGIALQASVSRPEQGSSRDPIRLLSAATPALALCIAALKARASQGGRG